MEDEAQFKKVLESAIDTLITVRDEARIESTRPQTGTYQRECRALSAQMALALQQLESVMRMIKYMEG